MSRLLAITDPGCEVSTRYRITQFEKYFAMNGVSIDVRPWPRDFASQSALLDAASQVDAVIVQRLLPKLALQRQLRRSARRLTYDFDDAVIYSESTHNKPHLKLSRWWRFRAMMRHCDVITAGSNHLKGLAQKHGAGERASLLPTVLEVENYEREAASPSSGPVLGWIGGRWTLPYLEQIREPLKRLCAEHPKLKLRVIADQLPQMGRVPVELIRWDGATEIRELKRLSIGLAPLPDDNWSRGKCGLRLLQYLAAGVPAVTSPVGTQAEIAQAGAALAANSSEEWYQALRRLLSDAAFAAQLRERGKQLVLEHYSVSAWVGRVREMWCGSA